MWPLHPTTTTPTRIIRVVTIPILILIRMHTLLLRQQRLLLLEQQQLPMALLHLLGTTVFQPKALQEAKLRQACMAIQPQRCIPSTQAQWEWAHLSGLRQFLLGRLLKVVYTHTQHPTICISWDCALESPASASSFISFFVFGAPKKQSVIFNASSRDAVNVLYSWSRTKWLRDAFVQYQCYTFAIHSER